jgi:hypothetical protein
MANCGFFLLGCPRPGLDGGRDSGASGLVLLRLGNPEVLTSDLNRSVPATFGLRLRQATMAPVASRGSQ